MKEKNNYDSYSYIVLRIFKNYIYPHAYNFFIAIIFMLVSSACVAYKAYLMKPAVDRVFVNNNKIALIAIPLKIVLVSIVSCAAVYVQGIIMHITNNKILLRLRSDLFGKLINKDMGFFQKNSASGITSYFNDINGISEIINIALTGLILQFFTVASLVGLMFYQNAKLSIISFIAFPLVIFPIIKIGKKMRKLSAESITKNSNVTELMAESFFNIETVKSNNKEDFEIKKNNDILLFMYKISVKIAKRSLLVSPLVEMVGTIGFAAVILYGGLAVINGTGTAGDFFLFITALLSAYKPLKSFTGLNIKVQHAVACAKRYFITMDEENSVRESSNPIFLEKVVGDIKFKNVYFSYPESNEKDRRQAITNLNIEIKPNSSYALVGHSGSGKTTIFKLLLRFYDVTEGHIYIDNYNIRDLSFKTLRENISLVSQNVRLFNTSIFENIKYAKSDATYEEVINASKMANVDNFVQNMQNGYDTIIGPDGSMLSGGQKQRISIARALLKNSPILLLDEATSALDPISEELIQNSLKILMKNRTTIIIAHRLSTIVNCNHIFVLENGTLVESGTHDELISLNKIYKSFCDKQFFKENANN